jgi:hypothetical protein
MKWGDTISVNIELHNSFNKKYCTISKNVRYSTYIFSGSGSKGILKYFLEKTKNTPEFKYDKIVQMMDSNSYRRFIPIRDWKTFWTVYRDEPIKDRHLFELIRSEQPCKPYLDIEWNIDSDNYDIDSETDARNIDHTDFIENLKHDIITIFADRYNIELSKDDILVSSSHSKLKVSFHIVIDKKIDGKTVVYKTNIKDKVNSAWDLWVALTEYDDRYVDKIDRNVYTLDREFRTLFSNKTSEFRPILPYPNNKKITENSVIKMKTSECLRYLVTDTSATKCYHITTPVPKKLKNYPENDDITNFYDNISLCSGKKMKHIFNLVHKVHKTAEYTGRSSCGEGWRFSYKNKDELCYTGKRHVSNGFYVFEDLTKGIIYMKCMSSNCKSKYILERKKQVIKKLF